MNRRNRFAGAIGVAAVVLLGLAASVSCTDDDGPASTGSGDLDSIAKERNLTPEDMKHALQQYVAPGKLDDYVMFASGGQSGQILVIGMPSMRILKTIAVFTPEPWQGYGYGADLGNSTLENGNPEGTELTWGDTHHPAISETGGEYDGRYLYIQDRANGRVAFVDLRDFRTKQIVAIPNIQTSHGGMFVTPNSEYVHVSSKFPEPWPAGSYADISEYQEKFRGASTWLKLDLTTGRINLDESFQIELPPYVQDLADAGGAEGDARRPQEFVALALRGDVRAAGAGPVLPRRAQPREPGV